MNIDLEDVLLKSHNLSSVWGGECDYGPEVECACGWKGDPQEYSKHLLVILGFHKVVLDQWDYAPYVYARAHELRKKGIDSPNGTSPELTEYINIYLGPKDQFKYGFTPKQWKEFSKEERNTKKKQVTIWLNKLREIQ